MDWIHGVKEKIGMNYLWSKGGGWDESKAYGRRMEWIYEVKEKDGMNLWSKGEGWNKPVK